MKFVNSASGKSAWRGYECYESGKVMSYEKTDEDHYCGKVKGSENNEYDVTIDIKHPRRSVCNCPFANGRYVVCKHEVALFFAVFPVLAEEYKAQKDKEEAEYEEWLESLPERVEAYVRKLSKKELQDDLLDILFDSDGWVLDKYIRTHDIDD